MVTKLFFAFLCISLVTTQTEAVETANSESSLSAVEEATGPLTLSQAVVLALVGNPELAVFPWDIRAAEARKLQASLWPNPELSIEIEGVRWRPGPATTTDTWSLGSASGAEREIERGEHSGFSEAEFTIQLSQVFELGGKRAKRVISGDKERDLVAWDYETAKADVITQAAKAFIDVLAAQERLRLRNEIVRLARRTFDTAEARVSAGKASPLELKRPEIELSEAQIDRRVTEGELESARVGLASLWGGRRPMFTQATGRLSDIRALPALEKLEQLLSDNPDVARWESEISARETVVSLEKANAIPDLEVGLGFETRRLRTGRSKASGLSTGGFSFSESRTGFDRSRDNTLLLEFSVPLPLFNRNQGTIQAASHLVRKAQVRQRAVELSACAKLGALYAQLTARHAEIQAMEDEVIPAASETFESISKGYELGKFGYLDVLGAQRTLSDARLHLLDAVASYHNGFIDIERLIGLPLFEQEKLTQTENMGDEK